MILYIANRIEKHVILLMPSPFLEEVNEVVPDKCRREFSDLDKLLR